MAALVQGLAFLSCGLGFLHAHFPDIYGSEGREGRKALGRTHPNNDPLKFSSVKTFYGPFGTESKSLGASSNFPILLLAL